MLPRPEVLLATKINSVPNRDKEHKRVKDVADIYALLWHSDEKLPALRAKLRRLVSPERVSSVVSNLNEQDFAAASVSIGVDKTQISRVIGELA